MIADFILYNANVLTLDTNYPMGELVAIRGDKILKVVGNEALNELKSSKTTVIDCQGKTVLPGFNDAHCHFLALAKSLVSPDLSPTKVHSILDIQREIAKLAQDLSPRSWIMANGYNEFYLAEKRHPNRWDLDKATSAHPIKLTHRSGHAHVLNSLALTLVGISEETPEPPGGIIERDIETGEPNGLLYNMGDFLAKRMPPPDDKELVQGVKLANKTLLSSGITSVQDLSPGNNIQRWQMFQQWKSKGNLRSRISFWWGIEGFNQYQQEGLPSSFGSKEIRLGGVKITLDETSGQLNPTQAELEQMVLQVHHAGLQVALHAIEEGTIKAVYSTLKHILQKSPRTNHRHRIEHCSICSPSMAKQLASLGVMVVTQPAFVYYSGERYLKTVPSQQLQHLYPINTLMKAGVKVAFSSDCPVAPANPLAGIYAAVSRRAETGEVILSEECISPWEALLMYTEGGAFASFEETMKGSITPGKCADLIILSADPTRVSTEEIKDLEVEMTIVGGEIVWRKEA